MGSIRKNFTDSSQIDSDKKLSTLQCPFTWSMDDIDETIDTDYCPHDEEAEFIPLLELMRSIMDVYTATKAEEDPKTVLNNLEKCDETIKKVMKE